MELILIGAIATIAFSFGYWIRKNEYDSLLQYSNSQVHTRDEIITDLQDKVKQHEEMRVTINEKANNFLREIQSHKEQEEAKKKTITSSKDLVDAIKDEVAKGKYLLKRKVKETKSKKKGKKK